MKPATWCLLVIGVVLLALINAWLASDDDRTRRPRLVVVATHDLPQNHKLGATDLVFAVTHSPDGDGSGVLGLDEAIGACTTAQVKEGHPVGWDRLRPAGTGEDSCANTAMAIGILDRVTRLANGPVVAGGKPSSSPATEPTAAAPPTVAPLREWLDLPGDPPAELGAAMRAALGEFRPEFVKEFAKHLADNAADRIFGRDRKDAAQPAAATVSRPPPDSRQAPPPAPLKLSRVSHFNPGRSVLTADQRELLAQFAAELLRYGDCRVTVLAYADSTGAQRDNLWLSRERGEAVANVLTANGLQRRLILVVPRGDQNEADEATGDADSASKRRVEIHASCATS